FFIRDAIKFPDFIHSQRRKNASGLRSHAMQWDFWTKSPETTHQVTWLMGDRGIPKTWRHMDGFGSHTYQMINAEGVRHWVKFHFKTNQGIDFLTQEEADTLAGENADYHRQDLFESIKNGEFPSWELHVQVMPVDEAENYRFNPFDLTKTWSQKDYPLIEVGKMTLNRNPENFHAQIEQSSFEPSNIVPGIGFSPDKMLLGRVFSYADAHRYRIGANYAQLPVNAPKVPVNSYSKDGSMRYSFNSADTPVYAPNSYGGPKADTNTYGDDGSWDFEPRFVRTGYIEHPEDGDFVQPGTLYREVMDDAARERLVGNIVGHALNGVTEEVLVRVFQYWSNVDPELGKKVEEGVRAGQSDTEPTTSQSPTAPGDEAAKV
ncbi:MAG: catalase, partial [Rhodococcus sp. (in: high G+C Gram-positive bacteria)]